MGNSIERVTKFFPAEVKAHNAKDLTVDHFISTEAEDRSGDTVYADGIEFDAQPMVLKNHGMDHDTGSEPIARCESWRVTTVDNRKGMLVRTKYYDGMHLTPPDNTGRRLFEKAIGGFMPFWSIGFGIKESEPKVGGRGRHLKRTVVYEYSQVGVPDNPTADVLKGFTPEQAKPEDTLRFEPAPQQPPEQKGATTPPRETKPAPKEGETEDDFLKRCIPMLIDEGKPQDQAAAICHSMWADRGKGEPFAQTKGASPAGGIILPQAVTDAIINAATDLPELKSFAQAIAGRVGLMALSAGHETFLSELLFNTADEKALKALLKEYGAFVDTHARSAWAEVQALRATDKDISNEELKTILLSNTKSVAPESSAAPTPAAAAGVPAPAAPAAPPVVPSEPPVVLKLHGAETQRPQPLPFTREQLAKAVTDATRTEVGREVRRMLGRVD